MATFHMIWIHDYIMVLCKAVVNPVRYMGVNASHFIGHMIVCSNDYPGLQQRNHQSYILLTRCAGDSPVTCGFSHKGPVMWKVCPGYTFIMKILDDVRLRHYIFDLTITKYSRILLMCTPSFTPAFAFTETTSDIWFTSGTADLV